MAKFGLELHSEKTRLIEFGRFAERNRKRTGVGKPETFNFPGFTHICSTIHKSGKFTVTRKTNGKRVTAKLRDIAAKLRRRMNDPMEQTGGWLTQWCEDTSTITQCRATCGGSPCSGGKQRGTGCLP